MRKRYWFYSLALIAIIFAVEYDVARRMNSKNPTVARTDVRSGKASTTQRAPNQISNSARTNEAATTTSQASTVFDTQFLQEAQRISNLPRDPKDVEQKMDQLARSMKPLDLKKLEIVMQNKNEDGDQRAMAVELISRSKTPEAMDALKDFVLTRENSTGENWTRNREFESVLRAQAIEGIAAFPQKQLALTYLNSMAGQIDESFLKDRIVRSEESLKGRAPDTQQQDEAALKQLVQ